MSYPRNSASPEPVAIGAVVQISDGAVQTAGVNVRVKKKSAAEGNGAGTIGYSTDGVVEYTPTQAETDDTSFILIASKAGCIPASITVVPSASATAGRVVLSSETHTGAVIPSVTLVDVTTMNMDMRGTDGANTVTPPTEMQISAQVAADLLAAHGGGSWQTATGFSTPADVNAQVLDVFTIDVFAELSAPPAANSSLKDKLIWLFMWARNKSTESLTQRKLYADDTTTVVSTETMSDAAGTFTKGEQV